MHELEVGREGGVQVVGQLQIFALYDLLYNRLVVVEPELQVLQLVLEDLYFLGFLGELQL